jgi:hypothetical protein
MGFEWFGTCWNGFAMLRLSGLGLEARGGFDYV